MLRTQLADNVKAREQRPDGSYTYVTHDEPAIDAQAMLYVQAYEAVGAALTQIPKED